MRSSEMIDRLCAVDQTAPLRPASPGSEADRCLDRLVGNGLREALARPDNFAIGDSERRRRFHDNDLHMEGRPYRFARRPLLIDAQESAALADRLRQRFEHVITAYSEHCEVHALFRQYAAAEEAIPSYPSFLDRPRSTWWTRSRRPRRRCGSPTATSTTPA
jgi:hypothetical protein